MKLSFFGAAGTVTGSRHFVEAAGLRLLVDCGLFQGVSAVRQRNWEPFPVNPRSIDAILLTHAHLDHSGYLPLLVRHGFRGSIYCSAATAELSDILLQDSGFLQEKDAEFANRHGYSKHAPALPLYTRDDARHALRQFRTVPFDTPHALNPSASFTLRRAGHILGAASIELRAEGRTIAFSGDVGRYDDPLLPDPTPMGRADHIVIESTYGDRLHARSDPAAALAEVVRRTVGRGGTVVVPAFAVGRAQSLMYYLQRLRESGQLAHIPMFLDSPMAIDASDIFCRNTQDHRLSADECRRIFSAITYVQDVEASKALTASPVPKVIISASGMATGGRVLHHLKHYLPDPRSSILFAGFQAPGTRGALMTAGADFIKIHGEEIPVRAEVHNLSMLSAHADADELLHWLHAFPQAPRDVFLTHGEPAAAAALKSRIEEELGWKAHVPAHLATFML